MGGSGGGGGGSFFGHDPKSLQDKIREAEESTSDATFATALEEYLSGKLAFINQREEGLVNERLEEIKDQLGETIEASYDLRFGGSVAKHTYVDGLSDIDSLIVLNADPNDHSPAEIKDRVADQLRAELPDVDVSVGTIAITLKYGDDMEIQLIPAVRAENKIMVPSWQGNQWSKIDPMGFQGALTDVNTECNGKVVPTIKLAKAINATLPEAHQLSGYHLEAIAVASFRQYDGPRTLNKMLPHMIQQVSTRVLTPVVDSTGQSVHVDEYLGASNNKSRKEISHVFDRLSKRIANATAAGSVMQWDAVFSED